MAITATLLTANANTTPGAVTQDTASITPTANTLILVAVENWRSDANTGDLPTLAGNSLTYVEIANIQYDTVTSFNSRLTLFRAMGAAPSAGVITITWANIQGRQQWAVVELANILTAGTNGSGAVVQSATNRANSVTSLTVTLAAFANAANATFGAFGGFGTFSPGTGFTELSDTDSRLQTEFLASNDTSVDSTCSSTHMGGIAVEIAEVSTGLMTLRRRIEGY